MDLSVDNANVDKGKGKGKQGEKRKGDRGAGSDGDDTTPTKKPRSNKHKKGRASKNQDNPTKNPKRWKLGKLSPAEKIVNVSCLSLWIE